jgi:hypothetical protein
VYPRPRTSFLVFGKSIVVDVRLVYRSSVRVGFGVESYSFASVAASLCSTTNERFRRVAKK